MADPLSVTSAVVGLIAVSCQASKALRETIHSYKNHTKTVRDLKHELEALEQTLQLLGATLLNLDGVDFAALEFPLRRCGCACEEFRQILEKCTRRNNDDKSTFRGWLKIRWMGSDINGFKDTLAGYKSTIAIAIAGVNLRTTRVSLDVVHEYKEMIQSTTTDLQEHLRNIDDEMHNVSIGKEYQSPVIDDMAMQSERDCTMRCLEICMRVDAVIEEQKLSMNNGKLDPTASGSSDPAPQRVVMDSLQSCKFNIQSANAELMKRLQYLSARLGYGTTDPLRAAPSDPSEHERMAEEFESIRQCLNICMQASEEAEKVRVNIVEDVTTAEDSRQILVSTVGDLITARRVNAGARSLQCIGQMSDETLQHMSRTHGTPETGIAAPTTESRHVNLKNSTQTGRTLGSSNVRTL